MLSETERSARLNVIPGRKRLVIDTDAKNEVDDQFAIAWALAAKDSFSVEAIYAVPFSHDCFRLFNQDRKLVDTAGELNGHAENPADGMEQSYQEILQLLRLMGESTEGRVFHGSSRYLQSDGQPVVSEAAEDLIRRSRDAAGPLYVAAIGALTNIASALLIDPTLANRIIVVWLGGHQLSYGHGIEFNLIQDVRAAQVLFDSGTPLIWVPCNNVASHLTLAQSELETRLLGRTPIADYLARTVLQAFQNPEAEIAMMGLLRSSSLLENCDQGMDYLAQFPTRHVAWSRIIWDIATIAALRNPNWTPSMLIPTPHITDDFHWIPGDAARPALRVITQCYRNLIFGDLFACLAG